MAQFTILEENRGTDKNSASGQLSALFAAGGSLFPVGLNAWVRVGGTESIYNWNLRRSYGPCSAGWTLVLPFLEFPMSWEQSHTSAFQPSAARQTWGWNVCLQTGQQLACSRLREVLQFSATRSAENASGIFQGQFLGEILKQQFQWSN